MGEGHEDDIEEIEERNRLFWAHYRGPRSRIQSRIFGYLVRSGRTICGIRSDVPGTAASQYLWLSGGIYRLRFKLRKNTCGCDGKSATLKGYFRPDLSPSDDPTCRDTREIVDE